ncbi:protein arginine N-methyltransferase 1 [Drosophila kikkawai]|uniref:Protein arginine N-methyltransferase 6 n=1 Tax=Drosophila kikkawai TaxID=30033 RepID=A0A6P4J1E2_DROKI|nr:protein arginine N-methyltransferase 1 [Drosophila kikkawai]
MSSASPSPTHCFKSFSIALSLAVCVSCKLFFIRNLPQMPGNKNTKTVKAVSTATNTRKKPIKLSLTDFHALLDQKKTPENVQKMNPVNGTAESQIWQSGRTRCRGSFCDRNLGVPEHRNPVTQVERSLVEARQTPKKSKDTANGFSEVPKEAKSSSTKASKHSGEPTKNGHSEKSKVVPKNHKFPKNGLSAIPGNSETNGCLNNSAITILKRPNQLDSKRGRPKTQVRSCPRIPTPPRDVPPELKPVDCMTSADFRHDYGAHLENMRSRLKCQDHMRFFAEAIQKNQHLFKGSSILVLCCGPGTLALMAAKAGARRVYAVDYSKVTSYTKLVVQENRMENIIEVIQGRIAAIRLPQKVDGILCNWMGHCLLFESEILEVLEARDRWLKEDGFILPDLGSLYLVGSEERMLKNDRCNWWLSVYGFNMNAMRRYALAEPRYAKTTGKQLLTLAHPILGLDLNTVKKEDLFIDHPIRLQVKKQGYLECFLLYFDVEFSRSHTPVKMSCNPCMRIPYKSLWQQTVLFVEKAFVMRPNRHYMGKLKFKPLRPGSLKEMEILIEFYGCENFDDDWYGGYCDRLVTKRWLMLEHFQTVDEVASCQDELVEI